ncbi:glucose-6-phosphate 1-dehydrogenase, cytoplasmic isoform [Gossypium australe]|uniref:Glucose-6-phosphate 1-dehydrogenase, cytoplasmic isoform n=1 Tax=Gossypium australe TaxID=47621 RepID=A0A5B6V6V3_9ROSI|nr:glucose-6-phosphate 1-dehydrogenase, cytoplasmic isoform [Gossypium australe]
MMQLTELDEWRTDAYENSRLYKEATKRRHDARLKKSKRFEVGDLVLTTQPFTRACLWLCISHRTEHGRTTTRARQVVNFSQTRAGHGRAFNRAKILTCLPREEHDRASKHSKILTCLPRADHGRALRACTMSSSRGKRTAATPTKKRKGPGLSSASSELRHEFLRFSQATQEERYKTFLDRPLGTGRCIDWGVLEQMVMAQYDDPGTVQFRLGGTCLRASKMLHMKMIKYRRGTDPPQCLLATDEEVPADFPDDVPSVPSRQASHPTASMEDISARLTQFEQYYTQCFEGIEATLQQICHHFHISSPTPPQNPDNDEDT